MKQNLSAIAIVVAVIAIILNLATPLKPINVTVQMAREVMDQINSFGRESVNTDVVKNGIALATRNVGGGVLRGDGMVFSQGTTTVCSLVSPTATSTWIALTVSVTQNATTTAREVSIATSTAAAPLATTSPVLDGSAMTIPAGAQWAISVNGTTSPSGSVYSRFSLLPPNTRIVVSLKGGNSGVGTTTELRGSCAMDYMTEGL